ncbi:MAG: permease-like cell division protein FtsX [Carbonactinosporaceae bacterium]
MRATFVFSEIGIGLRRNLTMTIAVIVSVAISLALFGAALLIRAQVDTMKSYWYDKVEVSIFLCKQNSDAPGCQGGAITDEQRQKIDRELSSLSQVKKVYYESQQEAYDRFKDQFSDSALAKNITPDQMPESFRVKLNNPEKYEIVASLFTGREGVDQVQDQREVLEPIFRVLQVFQVIAIVVALLMLSVALLLIINTIRVAAFSRRRETGIMRLVGASNFYIQLPFLLEGAIAGLIGAVLASVFVVAIKIFGIDHYLAPTFRFMAFIGWDSVIATIPILMIVGVAMSGLASFATLRKYLRV